MTNFHRYSIALFSLAAVLATAGCTTRYIKAPSSPPPAVSQFVVSAQIDTEPRVFFTDGITTVKTDFNDWAAIIAARSAERLSAASMNPAPGRQARVMIQSITCTGHFVADCQISVLVEAGDSYRRVVSTDKYNGYPILSALDKAIEASASSVAADPMLRDYLEGR